MPAQGPTKCTTWTITFEQDTSVKTQQRRVQVPLAEAHLCPVTNRDRTKLDPQSGNPFGGRNPG